MVRPPIIIVGASVRAAAESAAVAGYRVLAFDLFADQDLTRVAAATRLDNKQYPDCLISALEGSPISAPWLYTGGFENYARLIAQICKRNPLLGNDTAVVQSTRDPNWLAGVAAAAGWQFPRTLDGRDPGTIRKPLKHCGGFGTKLVVDKGKTAGANFVCQEFIDGPVFGGLFIGDAARSTSYFLGATRLSIASDVLGHPLADQHPFAYIGSEGPVALEPPDCEAWQTLGQALSAAAPLRGVYGVDAVKHATRGWVLLELNPRWTASVELLERAFSCNVFSQHIAACSGDLVPQGLPSHTPEQPFIKRIVYADERIEVDRSLVDTITRLQTATAHITVHDVPRWGTTIEASRPILTLMATSANMAAARQCLENALELLSRGSSTRLDLSDCGRSD